MPCGPGDHAADPRPRGSRLCTTTVVLVLRITTEVRDQMFAHAIAELPNEACGMFSVHDGLDLVDYFHGMRNTRASGTVFALDGQEMLDLERQVERAGRSLVGVMHSHTQTSAYPSLTNRLNATRSSFPYTDDEEENRSRSLPSDREQAAKAACRVRHHSRVGSGMTAAIAIEQPSF